MSQLTFTEDDFNKAQAYAKFVVDNMQLKEGADVPKAFGLVQTVNDFNSVLKKIHANIMELKKVTEAPVEEDKSE
jgi:hypothetical protein